VSIWVVVTSRWPSSPLEPRASLLPGQDNGEALGVRRQDERRVEGHALRPPVRCSDYSSGWAECKQRLGCRIRADTGGGGRGRAPASGSSAPSRGGSVRSARIASARGATGVGSDLDARGAPGAVDDPARQGGITCSAMTGARWRSPLCQAHSRRRERIACWRSSPRTLDTEARCRGRRQHERPPHPRAPAPAARSQATTLPAPPAAPPRWSRRQRPIHQKGANDGYRKSRSWRTAHFVLRHPGRVDQSGPGPRDQTDPVHERLGPGGSLNRRPDRRAAARQGRS
jgi:hypothetical protein